MLATVKEMREHDRAVAIQSIAKANSYAELAGNAALILEGTTGGNRSFAIGELAKSFKKSLSASAVSEALGSVQQLREHDRAKAIQTLVLASVPGPWSGEASEPLNGCTGGNRSFAITQLAPHLRANLTGVEVSSSSVGQMSYASMIVLLRSKAWSMQSASACHSVAMS